MLRSVLHKLLLARRLYELGRENLSSVNDLSLAIGVNLLQDSVEAFLLAVSEYVNAGVQSGTNYDKYFDLINSKISPKELPFRSRLVALNKLRVNSKHYGLAPAQSEVEGLLVTVREFLDEVTGSILGLSFATVSLIDLIRDGEVKELLKAAEKAFESEDFRACLVYCRKAIFVRIESNYNIAPFGAEEEPKGLAAVFLRGKSPFFARSKEYVDKNVTNATDYIVLDHQDIEMELLKSGIDSVSFWNVWRLTPEVYRSSRESEWVVKNEFKKMDEDGIKDRAEYVVSTTINLFVAADQRIAATRSPDHRRYFTNIRREEIPVYEKADTSSKVVTTTPKGVTKLFVDYTVPALNGEGVFWHVSHSGDGWFVWGYISEEEVAVEHAGD